MNKGSLMDKQKGKTSAGSVVSFKTGKKITTTNPDDFISESKRYMLEAIEELKKKVKNDEIIAFAVAGVLNEGKSGGKLAYIIPETQHVTEMCSSIHYLDYRYLSYSMEEFTDSSDDDSDDDDSSDN